MNTLSEQDMIRRRSPTRMPSQVCMRALGAFECAAVVSVAAARTRGIVPSPDSIFVRRSPCALRAPSLVAVTLGVSAMAKMRASPHGADDTNK